MGHSGSSEAGGFHELQLSEKDLIRLFRLRIRALLSAKEVSAMEAKVNLVHNSETEAVFTRSDLALLLQLSPQSDVLAGLLAQQQQAFDVLYRSFTRLGSFPFMTEAQSSSPQLLSFSALVVAIIMHSGRMQKLWPDYDHVKLLYCSLVLRTESKASDRVTEKLEFKQSDAGKEHEERKEFTPQIEGVLSVSDDQSLEKHLAPSPMHSIRARVLPANLQLDSVAMAKAIDWTCLSQLSNLDQLASQSVSAKDVADILTVMLICNAVPAQSHAAFERQLALLVSSRWGAFSGAAISILRFVDALLTADTLESTFLTYDQFSKILTAACGDVLGKALTGLVQKTLLLSVVSLASDLPAPATTFVTSRLTDEATVSLVRLFVSQALPGVEVTTQNFVPLYNGAHSGFSIRSLELKIFKWQAPTVLLISGKRLRSKTMASNKRYLQFDLEFPRFFRSTEAKNKPWQADGDRITYAVYVNEPWRHLNKSNFGDSQTAIACLSPHFDIFASTPGSVTGGKLVYFNNLGMGLGVGNDQPVLKNHVRKYLPGNILLTIEANLEFSVFRHIISASSNSPRYFQAGKLDLYGLEDYEDRFLITDLEVWGVGSTKELDEQRKQWEWEEKQAQARQDVNLRSLGEDRAFLEMAGLVGDHGQGGSM